MPIRSWIRILTSPIDVFLKSGISSSPKFMDCFINFALILSVYFGISIVVYCNVFPETSPISLTTVSSFKRVPLNESRFWKTENDKFFFREMLCLQQNLQNTTRYCYNFAAMLQIRSRTISLAINVQCCNVAAKFLQHLFATGKLKLTLVT